MYWLMHKCFIKIITKKIYKYSLFMCLNVYTPEILKNIYIYWMYLFLHIIMTSFAVPSSFISPLRFNPRRMACNINDTSIHSPVSKQYLNHRGCVFAFPVERAAIIYGEMRQRPFYLNWIGAWSLNRRRSAFARGWPAFSTTKMLLRE